MNTIIEHIDLWTTAQTQKSLGKKAGIDNISWHGINRLRELILELAVRGKLVARDSNDEPANLLLKKIESEKKKLIVEGELKKQNPMPRISEDEKLFEITPQWSWVRLGDVCQIIRGITFPATEKSKSMAVDRVACLRTSNVQDKIEWDDLLFIRDKFIKRPEQLVKKDDIVMSMANSRELVGKVAIVENEPSQKTTFGGFLGVIRALGIDSRFLMIQLRVPFNRNLLIESASQTTNIANISLAKLNPLVLALPPLAEQHRIVAKVDELMALCDKLVQQQMNHIETHLKLVEVLLQTLTNATNAEELKAAWQHLEPHFDILFTTEESIDLLKQTIQQLAVMGKLVPQDKNDEPASELLKKIAKEKARLVKEGKIKKQEVLPEIGEDEKPFVLPEGWEFAKMGTICNMVTDGTHQTPKYTESGRVFISAQNIKPFSFNPDNHRWVSEEDYQGYIQNRKPEKGDILLTRVGAGIGEAAVIDTDLEFAIYVSVGLLQFNRDYLFPNYLAVWLNSPLGRKHSEKNTYGKGVSQGNLNLSLIRNFPVSIPPINEQHKIVAKVDELMTLCDQLKERIVASQQLKVKLADAVVERAVATKSAGKVEYAANVQLDVAAEPE